MYYLEEERQGAGFPWANHVLMGAMLCCFAYELTLGPRLSSPSLRPMAGFPHNSLWR